VSALPQRYRAALAELGAQRFLSRRQLEELLLSGSTLAPGSRTTVVKRILRRLRERGLVQVSPRLFAGLDGIPGETAYSLTPLGCRVLGSGLAEQRGRGAVRGNFLLAHALRAGPRSPSREASCIRRSVFIFRAGEQFVQRDLRVNCRTP
jgi:hypothetical protein